jgi:predicted DNA-binding ribbon-helix-helix protein
LWQIGGEAELYTAIPALPSALGLTSFGRKGAIIFPMARWEGNIKSLIEKHSVMVNNHKTSMTLEDDFWQALNEIAILRRVSLSRLISSIDARRKNANLSSVLRVFILEFYKDQFDRRRSEESKIAAQ